MEREKSHHVKAGFIYYGIALAVSALCITKLISVWEFDDILGGKIILAFSIAINNFFSSLIPVGILCLIRILCSKRPITVFLLNTLWIVSGLVVAYRSILVNTLERDTHWQALIGIMPYVVIGAIYYLKIYPDNRNDEDAPDTPLYYFQRNGERVGPFTLNELMKQPITIDTLVWKNGQEGWLKAEQIDEIKERFGPIPPAI